MNEKSVRKLENYWAALVDNNSTGLDNIRNEEGDPQLALDLLDELNAARLVMQDDTSVFHDSDWPTPGEAMPSETGHLAIGTKIDGYVLTQFLGRGGMALVYAAEQVALSRIVALKLIRSGPLASEDDRFRFQSEIMATASLEHPGIVSIIDTGVWCGFHYFSMEFIDGPSLADVLREELIPPKTAAEYSLAIAQAVEHAHKNGVLHRDLKPSNIMLRRGSRPCILDFGLAKFYAHDALSANELTKTGTMVGTPSYMSPEQALGFSRQVTFASDVYSMGVVLYEMITGRPPFRAANSVETMRQVIDNDPAPPRTLNSEIPSDLETICLKCLSKLPMERYQTSQELADELQRFLEGRPIVARPISSVRRAWRWCQRNRMTAGLITLLVISLLSGTLVSSAMWWKSRRNEILATERGDKLVASNEQLGDAMLSFYDRALKEGAFLDLSTHFRNELTSEMNRYYGLMIENSDHDPEVTRKIVTQLLRLSEDYFNWGHDSTSLFILNSSDDYIDRLVSTSELAEPDVNLKTEFLYRQAAALWSSGSKVQAKETFLEALDWARKGIEFDRNEHTENLLKKIELGLIADEIVSKGFEQGGPKLLSFIEKLQHLEQQYPDSVKILDTLMEAYGKLAKLTPVAQQAIDGRRKKQDVMDRIIAISESTGAPAELYRSYRTSNLVFLAVAEWRAGNHEKATVGIEKSIAGFRESIARSPGFVRTRLDLAETLVLFSDFKWQAGDHNESLDMLHESAELFNGVIAQNEESSQSIRRVSQVHELIANRLDELDRNEESAEHRIVAATSFLRLFDLPRAYRGNFDLNTAVRLMEQSKAIFSSRGEEDMADSVESRLEEFRQAIDRVNAENAKTAKGS